MNKFRLQQPHFFLRQIFRRNVVDDLGDTDDLPGRVDDGRRHQGNLQLPAVLVKTHGLILGDDFPAFDPCQDLAFFVETIGGKEPGDGPADDFRLFVSEQAPGGAVPACHHPVHVHADDRIVGEFDDAGEIKPVGLQTGIFLDHPRQIGIVAAQSIYDLLLPQGVVGAHRADPVNEQMPMVS